MQKVDVDFERSCSQRVSAIADEFMAQMPSDLSVVSVGRLTRLNEQAKVTLSKLRAQVGYLSSQQLGEADDGRDLALEASKAAAIDAVDAVTRAKQTVLEQRMRLLQGR